MNKEVRKMQCECRLDAGKNLQLISCLHHQEYNDLYDKLICKHKDENNVVDELVRQPD